MLLNSDKYTRADQFLDMFKVHQMPTPEMAVQVNQGTALYENTVVNFDAQDSVVINAPQHGSWLVVLSVNQHGQLVYTYGVQSVNAPVMPRLPEGCLHLAAILVTADTEYIVDDDVHDMRFLFDYSFGGGSVCQCKCAALDNVLTDDDKRMMKEYFDQYDALRLEVERLKTLHATPLQVLRMYSDSGIEYELRIADDGSVYTVRVGSELDDITPPADRTLEYRFCLAGVTLNIVAGDLEDYVSFQVDVRSGNAKNDSTKATLTLSSPDVRFFNVNHAPQYRDGSFRINGLQLTKSGLHEQFSLNFRSQGEHVLRLTLIDEVTGKVIDDATALMNVRFAHSNHCGDGCLCDDHCTCMQEN